MARRAFRAGALASGVGVRASFSDDSNRSQLPQKMEDINGFSPWFALPALLSALHRCEAAKTSKARTPKQP